MNAPEQMLSGPQSSSRQQPLTAGSTQTLFAQTSGKHSSSPVQQPPPGQIPTCTLQLVPSHVAL